MTLTDPPAWLAELTDDELYDLTCNAYETSARRLAAQRELDRRAGPSDLELLSAALDEIYRLRRAFAYESRVIEAHYEGLKTFPKSRRKIAEEQVARMREAVTSSVVAYAGVSSQSLRRELANAGGRPLLTVASWRDEVTR